MVDTEFYPEQIIQWHLRAKRLRNWIAKRSEFKSWNSLLPTFRKRSRILTQHCFCNKELLTLFVGSSNRQSQTFGRCLEWTIRQEHSRTTYRLITEAVCFCACFFAGRLGELATMDIPGGRDSCRTKTKLGRSLALTLEPLAGSFTLPLASWHQVSTPESRGASGILFCLVSVLSRQGSFLR